MTDHDLRFSYINYVSGYYYGLYGLDAFRARVRRFLLWILRLQKKAKRQRS